MVGFIAVLNWEKKIKINWERGALQNAFLRGELKNHSVLVGRSSLKGIEKLIACGKYDLLRWFFVENFLLAL